MNPIPNPNIASLTWKIDNFATLTEELINSPSFASPTNKMNKQTSGEVSAECRVSLVNSKGEKCHTIVKQIKFGDDIVLGHNRGCTFARNEVVKRENGLLTENGSLIIYCEVKIIDEKKSNAIKYCESLTQDYRSLLESSKFSDVVLVVGGYELKAHKAILASRSVVFAAMFEHDCVERRTNRVDITDVEKEVFDDLLRFIYTGRIESLDMYAVDLLIAANKYQVDQLKSICSPHLIAHLTPESVARTLVLADMHHVTELKEKCVEYITKQGDGIKLADWKKICDSNLDLGHLLFQRK